MKQLLVLGGGAAGIVAAITAAEHAPEETRVLLLEKKKRIGKKLLATGNGRCNLSHVGITPQDYFTSNQVCLTKMLSAIEQVAPLDWFEQHGLYYRADETGRIYPYSNQASDVLNLLLYWLEEHHVQVVTDCTVQKLEKTETGFLVESEGQRFTGEVVICAFGGSAAPQFGTDGTGIRLVRPFGCKSNLQYPCLVPLRCKKEQVSGLNGIRVKADVTLWDGNTKIHQESGEIQFTEYGLSGIAVMQLSGWMGQQRKLRKPELRLNLFPQWEEQALVDFLHQRGQRMPNANIRAFMTGLLPQRIGLAVWKTLELEEDKAVSAFSIETWQSLAQGLQNWRFTHLEPMGWEQAQTTGGGIPLSCLEPESFQVKTCPGLYLTGEMVDCAGSCGGFNLHWAFGSGILAGRHGAERLKEPAEEG